MIRVALAGAAALAALSAPAGAQEAQGKIEVCRIRGVSELMDRKSVPIPAGTGFVNGIDPKTGADIGGRNFTLETTSAATLPPKPACVTIPAKIRTGDGKPIDTTYKAPLPSQLNVTGLSVTGRVAARFPAP